MLGERVSRAVRVLEDADELLREAGARAVRPDRLVVGTGPGSFTGLRMGLATARGLAFALDLPVAGRLDARRARRGRAGRAAGDRRAAAARSSRCVDGEPVAARRRTSSSRTLCVGDGAVRYRAVLEERGAEVPPDDDERHLPRARFHAAARARLRPRRGVEPLYLRIPDAERKA